MTTAEVTPDIRSYLEAGVRQGRFPGAVWWIGDAADVPVSRGSVGCAVVEPAREPASEDTVYDLASLTKPLSTAVLAVLMEHAGEVDLTEPCSRVLPELRRSPYESASALDLGMHRAGLPAWAPLYLGGGSREAYLSRIRDLPPAGPAGASLYSDLGYIALGIALQRTAGASLDVLFEQQVARPLGLSSIGYAVPRERFENAAPTERGNAHERLMAGPGVRDHPWRTEILRGQVHDANAHGLGGVAGHSGLFGTAADVAAIGAEILVGGSLGLGERARRRLLRADPPGGDRTFGFVLARASTAARHALPDDCPGHVGFTGTSMWLEPERARVSVLLTNRVHPTVSSEDFQPVRAGFHRLAFDARAESPEGF